MAAIQGAISAAERSMRSVFVGNIPYEATEEQLKDIFCEVGPVVSFRLVYDRETGKPKGYGFCEYKDQDTALSAMRNLNGYELNGRALRVDNAASEKSKEELKNLQASLGGPPAESPYGPEVEPNDAPDAISKAVSSLPPEQLYELMKQMKMCIQNNPNEARNMLLQNPQLAYALLQAQVIMRIIDPQVALSVLHRQNINPSLLTTPNGEVQQSVSKTEVSNSQTMVTNQSNSFNIQQPVTVTDVNSQPFCTTIPGLGMGTPPDMNVPVSRPVSALRTSLLGDRPPVGIGERPVGIGERPVGIGDRPIGINDRPVGIGERPIGIGDRPMGIGDRPMGIGDRPVGIGDRPVGIGDRPVGIGDRPVGIGDRPIGIGDRPVSVADRSMGIGDRPAGIVNEIQRQPVMSQIPETKPSDIFDPRIISRIGDRDMRQTLGDRDMRQLPLGDRDMRQVLVDQDLRNLSPAQSMADNRVPFDPRFRNTPMDRMGGATTPFDPRLGNRSNTFDQRNTFETAIRGASPTQIRFEVPRPTHPLTPGIPGLGLPSRPSPSIRGVMPGTTVSSPSVQPTQPIGSRMTAPAQSSLSTPDQEKAALIMQVLQLSDQQIAMLPPEQRQSIMILKEQIARSAQQ